MELPEFISTSLVAIVEGVTKAQSECNQRRLDAYVGAGELSRGATPRPSSNGGQVRKPVSVEFDVEVTVQETNASGVGAKLGIGGTGVGAGGREERTAGSNNRLRFSVPIVLPDGTPKHDSK